MSDITGAIHNDRGFDVAALMRHGDAEGGVTGFPDADEITQAALLGLECEFLVPASVGWVISAENATDVRAAVILEGATGPTTTEADTMLNDAGVFILPDVLANVGGVTVSYFEWVQDLQNYFWSESEIVGRLREIMNRAFSAVLQIATSRGVTMRTAALIKGIERVTSAKLARGVYP